MASNVKPGKWYNLAAQPNSNGALECYIYGEIGGWQEGSPTQANFMADLLAAGPVKKIDIRINSPGGDAFDALGIYNFLRAKGYEVTSYVDGLAASAASIIAMTGKVVMASNAVMILHEPFMMTMGSADELARASEQVRVIQDSLTGIYMARTGQTKSKIAQLMADMTPISAQMAKEMGFADEISDPVAIAASLSKDKFPKIAAKAPSFFAEKPAPKEKDMTPEEIQKIKDDAAASVRAEIATFKAEFGEKAMDYLDQKLSLDAARAAYAGHLKAQLDAKTAELATVRAELDTVKANGKAGFVKHDGSDGAKASVDDDALLAKHKIDLATIKDYAKKNGKKFDDVKAMMVRDLRAFEASRE
jgi:ATP-dependent protease ClpP protease subunit